MTKASQIISEFPADILCNIFLILFKTNNIQKLLELKREHKNFKDYALVMSHVCKHWRTIALDFAPIWTAILTDIFPLEQVAQYLGRSKSMKLSVSFSINNDKSGPGEKDMPGIIDLFRDHLDRVKLLHIHAHAIIGAMGTYGFLLDSAVNVETLTFESQKQECGRLIFMGGAEFYFTLGNTFTSNQFLCLKEMNLFTVRPEPCLPWFKTLTRLCLYNMDIEAGRVLKILEQCSEQLEYLTLIGIDIDSNRKGSDQTVVMHRVREVVIISSRTLFTSVLKRLEFPERITWSADDTLSRHYNPVAAMVEQINNFPTLTYSTHDVVQIDVAMRTKRLAFVSLNGSSPYEVGGRHQFEFFAEAWHWKEILDKFFMHISTNIPKTVTVLEVFLSDCSNDRIADIDLKILRPLALQNRDIKTIKFIVDGDEGHYADLQVKFMGFLLLLKEELSNGAVWSKVQTLCLHGFSFEQSTEFWSLFVEFMHIWAKLNKRLRIGNEHMLAPAIEEEIEKLFPSDLQ